MQIRKPFDVCSTLVSSYYVTAFALIGVYGAVTVGLPRLGGSVALVSRFPRTTVIVWLTGLAVAVLSLTVAFGMLIANSLSNSTTLGWGEPWQAAVAQHALGWASLAGVGVIMFHLSAAAQWLKSERLAYASQAKAVLDSSQSNSLGPDVREVELDRHLISAFPQTGMILVSRHSVAGLTADEMGAALSHERAHISGHHALVVTIAQLAMAAAAGVKASKRFARTVKLAVEFNADDVAVKSCGRDPLASAIRATAETRDPLAELRLARLGG